MPDVGALSFIGNHHHRDMWRSIVARIGNGIPGGHHLIIWDWSFLEKRQMIHQRFPFDEYVNLVVSMPGMRPVLLIDSMNEAPQYETHISPLVEWLCDRGAVDRRMVIHCTGGVRDPHGVHKMPSNSAFCLGHYQSSVPGPWQHHFIMLNRIPKPLRVMASVGILEKGLDSKGYISCGVHGHPSASRFWIERNVPFELRHRFPLVLDDEAIRDHNIKQFSVDDDRIRCAAVNVISETSQDAILEVDEPWSVWNDIFITEKTAKAFRLCQLPMWVAVPGTVEEVRMRGFDVFDDIIDHRYDGEKDPHARMGMVVDQLSRLCGMEIGELRELRTRLADRLDHNRRLVNRVSSDLIDTFAGDLSVMLARIAGTP